MSECVVWPGKYTRDGYGRTYARGTSVGAHRKVMADIHGWGAIEGRQVNHHCDVKGCVNPEHLYIGTQKENLADCRRRGRTNHAGEHNGNSKLTAADVRDIRAAADMTQRALAEAYGVSVQTINMIVRGRMWS